MARPARHLRDQDSPLDSTDPLADEAFEQEAPPPPASPVDTGQHHAASQRRARTQQLLLGPAFNALGRLLLPPLIASGLLLGLAYLYGLKPEVIQDSYHILAVATFFVTFFIFRDNGQAAQQIVDTDYLAATTRAFGRWMIVIAVLALIGYALKVSTVYSRRVLLTWFAITPFAIAAGQLAFYRLVTVRTNANAARRRFIVAGVSPLSMRLSSAIMDKSHGGMSLLGYFDDRSTDRLGPVAADQLLGSLAELPDYVRRHQVDVIYIALPIRHEERMLRLLDELQDTTASIYFAPDIFVFDLIQSRIDMIDDMPVVALCESPFVGMNGLKKRTFDLVAATLGTLAALPVMLAIAIAVKITTPGSVLFAQRRYGLDGHEIRVYKFRTMTSSDDGEVVRQAQADDDRITPLGRFLRKYSLDELPQLINVIQGRMSLVGPRPHAVAHNELYRKQVKGYMIRHKVPPGITGLAQVNGCRGETRTLQQMESRVHYDLEYLRTWSVTLDLKIILKTLLLVWKDSRAY